MQNDERKGFEGAAPWKPLKTKVQIWSDAARKPFPSKETTGRKSTEEEAEGAPPVFLVRM